MTENKSNKQNHKETTDKQQLYIIEESKETTDKNQLNLVDDEYDSGDEAYQIDAKEFFMEQEKKEKESHYLQVLASGIICDCGCQFIKTKM